MEKRVKIKFSDINLISFIISDMNRIKFHNFGHKLS